MGLRILAGLIIDLIFS